MQVKKINLEAVTPEKYPEWNSFVDNSEQGNVFCYSWWLDAASNSNFKILVLRAGNEIVAGVALAHDRFNKINQPALTRFLGVLFKRQSDLNEHSRLSNQRKWLCILLEHIPVEGFVQMCLHHSIRDCLPFRWKGLQQATRYTRLINYLDISLQDLKKNLNRGRRNIINRAYKNGILVEESDDFKLLIDNVRLSYIRQNQKFNLPFEDIRRLDEAAKKNNSRLILKAVDQNGIIHAMMYLVFDKKSAYYLLSGSDPQFRKMGGQSLLLWESINFFSDKVQYFNFCGSDIKAIEEHISGFGGVLTPYFNIYNEKSIHQDEIGYHLKGICRHLSGMMHAIKLRVSGLYF